MIYSMYSSKATVTRATGTENKNSALVWGNSENKVEEQAYVTVTTYVRAECVCGGGGGDFLSLSERKAT